MKMDIRTGCACAAMLVALAWSADADAQRSPWWERQKAASVKIQAEWVRHGLHDPNSLRAEELRREVRAFGASLHAILSSPLNQEED